MSTEFSRYFRALQNIILYLDFVTMYHIFLTDVISLLITVSHYELPMLRKEVEENISSKYKSIRLKYAMV